MAKTDLTVTLKPVGNNERGISYAADVLVGCHQTGGGYQNEPTLTFICSGSPTTVLAKDVASIELRVVEHGACNHCGASS